ncbi:MAG TPA: DUF3617 domain-containing protein [Terriglobales bacterium]|nr:DUF3617 domain-containing protein [Terriglobales bacterium]
MRVQNVLHAVSGILLVLATATNLFSQTQTSDSQAEPHGVKYQPLNVKPGLWEKTFTITRTGALPIPPEMLNRLTPEQRARMEERMKANSAGHTSTNTERSCITKEDLEKPIKFDNRCTWTIVESTNTKAKGNVSCEDQGMKVNGNGEYAAPDPEHMKGSMHTTTTGGGNTMNVDVTFASKWVGASCEK